MIGTDPKLDSPTRLNYAVSDLAAIRTVAKIAAPSAAFCRGRCWQWLRVDEIKRSLSLELSPKQHDQLIELFEKLARPAAWR